MADEYKALTNVNLPFLDGNGRLYPAGQSIPAEAFAESASLAGEAFPNHESLTSAEDMIKELTDSGSISDDPDAPLHPDHLPTTPGAPTVGGLAAQAQALVQGMEESGMEVPAELRAFADSVEHVTADDNGSGGDVSA